MTTLDPTISDDLDETFKTIFSNTPNNMWVTNPSEFMSQLFQRSSKEFLGYATKPFPSQWTATNAGQKNKKHELTSAFAALPHPIATSEYRPNYNGVAYSTPNNNDFTVSSMRSPHDFEISTTRVEALPIEQLIKYDVSGGPVWTRTVKNSDIRDEETAELQKRVDRLTRKNESLRLHIEELETELKMRDFSIAGLYSGGSDKCDHTLADSAALTHTPMMEVRFK